MSGAPVSKASGSARCSATLGRVRVIRFVLPAGMLALLAAGWLALPRTQEVLRRAAPHGDEDVEYFGGDHALGQIFVMPADGLAELTFWLRPPVPAASFPIFVHLRHGPHARRDLRTIALQPAEVRADGFARVRFDPIRRSGGRPYALVLEAPNARAALAAYREVDNALYADGHLFRDDGVLRPGDLQFSASVRQRRGALLRGFSPAPPLRRSGDLPGAPLALFIGVGAFAAALALGRPRVHRYLPRRPLLAGLVVIHVLLHLPFVRSYPGVNDEGAYLMDIQNLKSGIWPFRDTLTKGPLFLAVLAPVVLAAPPSVVPARMLVVCLSAINLLLVFRLGDRLAGRGGGLLAASLWAFSPLVITQTTQLFLQPLELVFVLSALLIILSVVDPPPGAAPAPAARASRRRRIPAPTRAGILLAAAYLTRASALAFLVPALLLPWLRRPRRTALKTNGLLAAGFLGTLLATAIVVLPLLGSLKTAVFFNLEAYVIGQARSGGSFLESVRPLLVPRELLEVLSARGAAVFRAGAPLALLALAWLSGRAASAFRVPPGVGAIVFAGAAVALTQQVARAGFFMPAEFGALAFPFRLLSIGATALAAWLLAQRTDRFLTRAAARRELAVLGGAWLGLAALYSQFGRFRQHYHAEFLPLYVLAAALFLAPFLRAAAPRSRRLPAALALGALAAGFSLAYLPALRIPPLFGSLDLAAASRVAEIIRAHTAPDESVFTAQGFYVYLADRRLFRGAAHPGWYLEEKAGAVPTRLRRLYFPDRGDLPRLLEEGGVRLAVSDRRTYEIYLDGNPELQRYLEEKFRPIATIENPLEERPVTVYLRKDVTPH